MIGIQCFLAICIGPEISVGVENLARQLDAP